MNKLTWFGFGSSFENSVISRFVSILLVVVILLSPAMPLVALAEETIGENTAANSVTVSTETLKAEVKADVVVIKEEVKIEAKALVKEEVKVEEKIVVKEETKEEVKTEDDKEVTEEVKKEEANDEESDEEDIDLGDDQAELDAQKDFTAVVRQSKDYYCGPASLATLLTQLGNDTSEGSVIEKIREEDLNSEKGTNLLALKNASIELGNKTYLKRLTAEEVLAYIEATEDPVLIHDEKKDVGGHFSVIKSYDAKKALVELSDTEAGNIKYSVEDFKHIYTGEALIISTDETNKILNDTTKDISDADAANIWGKYVPVVLYAQMAGYTSVVNAFRICTANAIKLKTVNERNNARRICYQNMGTSLGSQMGNFAEATMATVLKLNDNFLNSQHKSELNPNLNLIASKYWEAKNAHTRKQTIYDQKLKDLANLKKNGAVIPKDKVDKLNQLNSLKLVLPGQISSKQTVFNNLNNEINSGTFTQNGITFSLGTVGNQVTAQSATYSKLSANLSAKLSSLNGQISQAEKSRVNAQSNYNLYNNQANSYQSKASSAYSNYQNAKSASSRASSLQSQANSAYSSYQYYNRLGSRYRSTAQSYLNQYYNYNNQASQARNQANGSSSYLSEYNRLNNLANGARSNASYWQGQINSFNSQISSLNNQKTQANNEVNSAAAEKARLERLKIFGNQEIQRKKGVLVTLSNDLNVLKSSLSKTESDLATLNTEISKLKTQSNQTALQNEVNTLVNELNLLSKEVNERSNEYYAEEKLEKQLNNEALGIAVNESSTGVANAWTEIKTSLSKPGTILTIAGTTIVIAGGSAICIATAPVCATVLGYTATTVGTLFTVNGLKVITTQSNIFGTSVSDTEWGKAVIMLPVDVAGTALSVGALKSILYTKYGATQADNMVAVMTRGASAEASLVKGEVGVVVRGSTSISQNVVQLLKNANQIDPADAGGVLTKAGRALEKHSNREISAFPKPTGNPTAKNELGNRVVSEILNDSSKTIKYSNDGEVFSVRLLSGKGLRFYKDGILKGFLEPGDL